MYDENGIKYFSDESKIISVINRQMEIEKLQKHLYIVSDSGYED